MDRYFLNPVAFFYLMGRWYHRLPASRVQVPLEHQASFDTHEHWATVSRFFSLILIIFVLFLCFISLNSSRDNATAGHSLRPP